MSVLSRRSLQSKLLPPGAMPPCSTTISMDSKHFLHHDHHAEESWSKTEKVLIERNCWNIPKIESPGVWRKLISIPSKIRLSSIAINGSQHSEGRGHAQIMLVIMTWDPMQMFNDSAKNVHKIRQKILPSLAYPTACLLRSCDSVQCWLWTHSATHALGQGGKMAGTNSTKH